MSENNRIGENGSMKNASARGLRSRSQPGSLQVFVVQQLLSLVWGGNMLASDIYNFQQS